MTGKSISRSCSDLDETVLSVAEIKAIATGNPLLSEKMTIDNDVVKLQLVKNSWANERIDLQRKIETHYPTTIAKLEQDIKTRKDEIAILDNYPIQKDEKDKDIFSIKINQTTYDSRSEAYQALTAQINPNQLPKGEKTTIGEYRGLKLSAQINNLTEANIYINNRYETNFTDLSGIGNLTRLQNKVDDLPRALTQKEQELADHQKNLAMAKIEVNQPFAQENQLSDLLTKQAEINRKIEFGITDEPDKKTPQEETILETAKPEIKTSLPADFMPPKEEEQQVIELDVDDYHEVKSDQFVAIDWLADMPEKLKQQQQDELELE